MKTTETSEMYLRDIGMVSARLVREKGEEYVELFVRLKSAGPKADRLKKARESERYNRLKKRAEILRSKNRGRK